MSAKKDTPTAPRPADPRQWKIYPRNLTARADYIVPGNPVTTRPEDAVDNCYPGLELDARNIQKFFFTGLYFEVYRDDGARLQALTPPDKAKQWLDLGLRQTDLQDDLYLWVLQGRISDDAPDTSSVVQMRGEDGLFAWRKANGLYPGKTAVVFGPRPAQAGAALDAANQALQEAWRSGTSRVQRDTHGRLAWAVLMGERTDYLNAQGVLSEDVYRPGELTRTLCTPWTYDFRDCQCFYWASNKPDTVESQDGRYRYLNFQRKNRAIEPQTPDIAYGYAARRAREIDYAGMMVDWQQLRPVLNGREYGETYTPPEAPSGPLLTLEQIKDEVSYLATVEHALAVQYLYAYYSVNLPERIPDLETAGDRDLKLWQGADEIFQIAIDEMRHFRWANEILRLLGADTTAKRATLLGRRFKIPFYLQSLSSAQLQWFVDLERPSRSTLYGLDGMYVGILCSLQALPDSELDPARRRRAVEIAKLIIDEGEGHYVRFSTVQQNFSFYDDDGRNPLPVYIRPGQWRAPSAPPSGVPFNPLYGGPTMAPPDTEAARLQQQSDKLYQMLLMLLKIAFAVQDEVKSGEALRQAIAFMLAMNGVNLALARKQGTPLFTLPGGWSQDPPIRTRGDALALLQRAQSLTGELADADAAAAQVASTPPTAPASVRAAVAHPGTPQAAMARIHEIVSTARFPHDD